MAFAILILTQMGGPLTLLVVPNNAHPCSVMEPTSAIALLVMEPVHACALMYPISHALGLRLRLDKTAPLLLV